MSINTFDIVWGNFGHISLSTNLLMGYKYSDLRRADQGQCG